MQVAALAKVLGSEPVRTPHVSGPDTPVADTSIVPFFEFTCTLQSVSASLFAGASVMATTNASIARWTADTLGRASEGILSGVSMSPPIISAKPHSPMGRWLQQLSFVRPDAAARART